MRREEEKKIVCEGVNVTTNINYEYPMFARIFTILT